MNETQTKKKCGRCIAPADYYTSASSLPLCSYHAARLVADGGLVHELGAYTPARDRDDVPTPSEQLELELGGWSR